MSPTQKPATGAAAPGKPATRFTLEERAALKERAKGLKAAGRRGSAANQADVENGRFDLLMHSFCIDENTEPYDLVIPVRHWVSYAVTASDTYRLVVMTSGAQSGCRCLSPSPTMVKLPDQKAIERAPHVPPAAFMGSMNWVSVDVRQGVRPARKRLFTIDGAVGVWSRRLRQRQRAM